MELIAVVPLGARAELSTGVQQTKTGEMPAILGINIISNSAPYIEMRSGIMHGGSQTVFGDILGKIVGIERHWYIFPQHSYTAVFHAIRHIGLYWLDINRGFSIHLSGATPDMHIERWRRSSIGNSHSRSGPCSVIFVSESRCTDYDPRSGSRQTCDRQIMGIYPAALHLPQLPTHDTPLQYANDDRTEREKRNCASKPNHPTFGALYAVINVLYIALHGLIGYGLCFLAAWIVWRRLRIDRFNIWTAVRGLLIYVIAAGHYLALPLWQGRFSDQRLGAGKPAERERELCSGHLPAEFRADAQLQRIRRRRLRGQEIEDRTDA